MGRSPRDWTRANISTLQMPDQPLASGMQQVAAAAMDDEEQDRRRRLQRLRDAEREAEIEEARLDREIKQLERQKRLADLQRAINGGEEQGKANAEIIRDLMQQHDSERREMLAEIREVRKQSEANLTQQLQTQLKSLENQLGELRQPQPSANPLDVFRDMAEQFKTFKQAQTAITEAVGPTVQPDSDRLSRREQLEDLRIREEVALRRMDTETRLEEARAKREAVRADVQMKSERIDKITKMAEGTLGPLVAHFIGDKAGAPLANALGATPAVSAPSAAPAIAAPQPGARMLPFRCPNPECNHLDYVPEGTTSTTCVKCGAAFGLGPGDD